MSRKMGDSKVLFIMHMPPPVHGAAMVGQWVHDSKLINEQFDCHYINLATAKNLEDIGKFSISKLKFFLNLLKTIKNNIELFKPNLVYVTPNACGFAFYKDYVVVQMLKRLKKRYNFNIIVHYHNKGVSDYQDKWLDNILYKRYFKGLKVILLSPVLFEDMKKYLNKEQVFICPNGNPETITFEPLAERKNKVPQILFLSNLIISKGVIVLLDALVILKKKNINFHCIFVGGETAEIKSVDFYDYIAERGLTGDVEYVGRKYGEEKNSYLEKSDIFVFPSYYKNESFPLVNLEAMEWKLPVVSTDEGGITDVVKDGENGFIVPCVRENGVNYGPRPIDLAEKMGLLLNDQELRCRMGENGYKKFKTYYTLSRFEEKFSSILYNCLGK